VKSSNPTSTRTNSRKLRGTGIDATLQIGAIWAIPEILRDLGADPADVCAEAGIDIALFDDPNNLISFRAASRLFRVGTERTGCSHFGLLQGQKYGLKFLGFVGLLVKYSPDVGSALRSLVRYLHLHIRGAVTKLEVVGKTAMFSYEIYQADAEATDQIKDAAVATMYNIMRDLCGPHWDLVEVRLSHRKPADVAPFRRFFQAPLLFDADENALVFFADTLRRPLPEVDPALRRLLTAQIEALEQRYSDQFPEQVRSVLHTALLTDHARADQVASIFSMHSRTLHRRLTAAGTSFRELLEESRYAIARQMLADTNADVSRVANVLNYADSSAFTRAFRRWSGTTPAQWRVRGK
jgi:AraC-like DNA-binding protein